MGEKERRKKREAKEKTKRGFKRLEAPTMCIDNGISNM